MFSERQFLGRSRQYYLCALGILWHWQSMALSSKLPVLDRYKQHYPIIGLSTLSRLYQIPKTGYSKRLSMLCNRKSSNLVRCRISVLAYSMISLKTLEPNLARVLFRSLLYSGRLEYPNFLLSQVMTLPTSSAQLRGVFITRIRHPFSSISCQSQHSLYAVRGILWPFNQASCRILKLRLCSCWQIFL